MIRIEGVHFEYGSDHVEGPAVPGLDDVSLEVAEGESVLLCGPSGSGKSSVLRLANGLIPHYHPGQLKGRVRVEGEDVPNQPLHATGRLTSTVFQNPRTQFFSTQVRPELAFASENFGVPPEEIRSRIAAVDAALSLGPLLDGDLMRMSGGQRQLVACGAAMVNRPLLYLFDEPASNLSPHSIQRLRSVLADLRAQGATMLIAEHRLYYLRDLVDRVVLLRDGRVTHRYRAEEFWALSPSERRQLGLRALTECHRPPDLVANGVLPPATGSQPHGDSSSDGCSLTSNDEGLTMEDVRFAYGQHQVLDIPHLHFPSGSVTVLTGPNGAGKSSLARVVCGLARSKGRVLVDGQPLRPRARQRVCHVVLQDVHRQLFASSVAEELTLGTHHKATDPAVQNTLENLGLTGLADRHPMSLSGGQKQRLVVAAAGLSDKKVHIFDEPTSGLDLGHLEQVAILLRRLADEGRVVIVITHDGELTQRCADQVVELQPLDDP